MKSITTIEKEFLLQRLELSHDLTHAISCRLEEKIVPLEKEIERLDRLITDCFPYEIKNTNVQIDVPFHDWIVK